MTKVKGSYDDEGLVSLDKADFSAGSIDLDDAAILARTEFASWLVLFEGLISDTDADELLLALTTTSSVNHFYQARDFYSDGTTPTDINGTSSLTVPFATSVYNGGADNSGVNGHMYIHQFADREITFRGSFQWMDTSLPLFRFRELKGAGCMPTNLNLSGLQATLLNGTNFTAGTLRMFGLRTNLRS